jgi:hypothetical protein
MMLARIISLAALAAVAGAQLMPSAAEAGMRICFPFLICPHPTPSDDGNYEPGYEGEEPVYIAPKRKTAKAAPAPKPSGAVIEKKAVSSTGKKTASAATAISCDKAEEIVSGYVTPATCTGQVFAFNATRSGNTYVIKLNSVSSELTEVRKVQ